MKTLATILLIISYTAFIIGLIALIKHQIKHFRTNLKNQINFSNRKIH